MRGDGSHDRRLPRTAIAIVAAGIVLVRLGPVLPEGGDCYDAPCNTGAVVGPWIVLVIIVVWVLALAWLIIAFVRKRR
jgi:uncharacterized membrane protein YidH (DUF202 family)